MTQKILAAVLSVLILSVASVVGQNANMNANVSGVSVPEPPAKSTVRGRVFYADTGRPVRRASIMLLPEGGGAGPDREGGSLTDSEGYFAVKNVRAGVYYAMVNAPGVVSPIAFADFGQMGPGGSEREAFEGAFARFEKIVVNGITDVEIMVPAKRGGAISGRITYEDGDPAVGVRVEVERKQGDNFLPVIPNFSAIMSLFTGTSNQTDDRGAYRFAGLPAGEYRVKVTENVSHSDTQPRSSDMFMTIIAGSSSLVTVYYPDVKAAEKESTIPVDYGTEAAEINVVLPNHGLYGVSGKVVASKDKTPLKNAVVTLKRKNDTEISIFEGLRGSGQISTADEQGNWSFKQLPKGEYQLVVEVQPSFDHYGEIDDAESAAAITSNVSSNSNSVVTRKPKGPPPTRYAKKLHEFTVTDKDLTGINIEMGFGATISGALVNDISSAVTIDVVNEDSETKSTETIHNMYPGDARFPGGKRGLFRIENVAVGKTTFLATVDDENFYVKSVTHEGRDLFAGPIELKEGQSLEGVQIVLGKDVGELTGKVFTESNEPARRAPFILVPTDPVKRRNVSFYRSVTADEEGAFKVKTAPGEYAVLFTLDKRRSQQLRRTGKLDKWLDDAIKSAQKVTVKEKESTTTKIIIPVR